MWLYSCSKKKFGGGADCMAVVNLSVSLKLPACLFVFACLFPCLPAQSFNFFGASGHQKHKCCLSFCVSVSCQTVERLQMDLGEVVYSRDASLLWSFPPLVGQ